MWHVYFVILICSAAAFTLAVIEPYTKDDKIGAKVNWLAIGAVLFVLYWLIQLART